MKDNWPEKFKARLVRYDDRIQAVRNLRHLTTTNKSYFLRYTNKYIGSLFPSLVLCEKLNYLNQSKQLASVITTADGVTLKEWSSYE